MGYRKKPKETKLFLVIYFTLFLIYRLTTPTLKYRPWIIPQQVVEGPPIQLSERPEIVDGEAQIPANIPPPTLTIEY